MSEYEVISENEQKQINKENKKRAKDSQKKLKAIIQESIREELSKAFPKKETFFEKIKRNKEYILIGLFTLIAILMIINLALPLIQGLSNGGISGVQGGYGKILS